MSKLPDAAVSPTVAAIWQHYKSRQDTPRAHLGASVIGRPCERQLWYSFRWCYRETFDGRTLRLFARGHREEHVFAADLRAIGVKFNQVDQRTGKQFSFSTVGGHVGGSMDGEGVGFPEAPTVRHVIEFKTSSAKAFKELAKGVKVAKPEHWAQIQLYMRWSGINAAIYMSVNKDTDDIHCERIEADAAASEALEAKAQRIVTAAAPLPGISDDPAWYECKFCPAAGVCHRGEGVQINCRTCVHSTPELDGDGRWTCAQAGGVDIPADVRPVGCPSHRLIPALVRWATPVDSDEATNVIHYEMTDGTRFSNGGTGGLPSSEIARGPEIVRASVEPIVAELREKIGATVKRVQPHTYRWREYVTAAGRHGRHLGRYVVLKDGTLERVGRDWLAVADHPDEAAEADRHPAVTLDERAWGPISGVLL